MLNFNEYQKLSELIKSNPELEPIINNMSSFSLSELSIDSHDIKNYIAYLKTTFQLVRKKSPEICDNPYFNRMEKSYFSAYISYGKNNSIQIQHEEN